MTNTAIVLVLAATLSACQPPQSRIKKNQAAFDAFPSRGPAGHPGRPGGDGLHVRAGRDGDRQA